MRSASNLAHHYPYLHQSANPRTQDDVIRFGTLVIRVIGHCVVFLFLCSLSSILCCVCRTLHHFTCIAKMQSLTSIVHLGKADLRCERETNVLCSHTASYLTWIILPRRFTVVLLGCCSSGMMPAVTRVEKEGKKSVFWKEGIALRGYVKTSLQRWGRRNAR